MRRILQLNKKKIGFWMMEIMHLVVRGLVVWDLIDGQLSEGSIHAEQIVSSTSTTWTQRFIGFGNFLFLEPSGVFLHLVAPLF